MLNEIMKKDWEIVRTNVEQFCKADSDEKIDELFIKTGYHFNKAEFEDFLDRATIEEYIKELITQVTHVTFRNTALATTRFDEYIWNVYGETKEGVVKWAEFTDRLSEAVGIVMKYFVEIKKDCINPGPFFNDNTESEEIHD